MCGVCTSQLDWRYGNSQVGALGDVTPLGMVVPPIGAQQALSNGAGSSGSGSTIKEAASAVKSGADSIKTVAIVVGAVTGIALLYIIYKQSQTANRLQENAFQLFREHPQALHAVAHI